MLPPSGACLVLQQLLSWLALLFQQMSTSLEINHIKSVKYLTKNVPFPIRVRLVLSELLDPLDLVVPL